MLFSAYLPLALAATVLAIPQEPRRTTTTVSRCTGTITSTIASVTTVTRSGGTSTITVSATATGPTTSPTPELINVVGFRSGLCYNPAVAFSGAVPNVQLVSLTLPPGANRLTGVPINPNANEGSCVSFDNGEISSLLFESVPDTLRFRNTCRLVAFHNVGCDEGNGSIDIDISQAQRGLCQDPSRFKNINSLQIRC